MHTLPYPRRKHFQLHTILLMGALLLLCSVPPCTAGEKDLSPVAKVFNQELTILERDFVPLAEAMPADKYGFAPTGEGFTGVRTFAQQISHTAATIYGAAAAVLEEKLPAGLAGEEYGPDTLKTKVQLVAYLKGAFEYAHKGMAKLTAANITDEVKVSWGKPSRLFMADMVIWHSFDHYGQLVEYLRMNGIIPPASRPKEK